MKKQFLNGVAWTFYHLGLLSKNDYENWKINSEILLNPNVRLVE